LFCPPTIENLLAEFSSPTTKEPCPEELFLFFNFIPLSGSLTSSYIIGDSLITSLIAFTKLDLSSVSKSSSSPVRESNSLIASTILFLLVVSKLEISPFFLPLESLG